MYKVVHTSSFQAPSWAQNQRRSFESSEITHVYRPSVTPLDDEQSPVELEGFQDHTVEVDERCNIQVTRWEPYVRFSTVNAETEDLERVFTLPLSQARVMVVALSEIVAALETTSVTSDSAADDQAVTR